MTNPRGLRKLYVLAICLGVFSTGARGQSVTIEAGNLRGSVEAGMPAQVEAKPKAGHRGKATCVKSVTVRSKGGTASSSATAYSSSGGESAVAASGGPGSTITTNKCGSDRAASPRRR